jgi:predicted nucleic acid-binding protein
MVTAVDTSVLLDVVTDDARWADLAEAALRQASREGSLVIGECVLAEITPALGEAAIAEFLGDWNIRFIPSTVASATLAGKFFGTHLARGGKRGRVIPDFLIAAHAQTHADRLLARDRGYVRDYFKKLPLWDPAEPRG